MFARYYRSASYLQRYRESPHKARIDHVAAVLVARRYRDPVISQHLHEWLEFSSYLDERGIALPSSAQVPAVAAYLAQRLPRGSASRRRCIRAAVRIFLDTDDHGQFPLRTIAPVRPIRAWCAGTVQAYRRFLHEHRGLADRTLRKRVWQLGQFAEFLEPLGLKSIAEITATQVQEFCAQLSQGPATRLTYGVTLRSLLRWAHVEGLLPTDLSGATITARRHRHRGLRDVLSEEDVHRLLTAVDRSSPVGRRDYAVLLLAARYGLRPSDIRQLRLDDVNWRQGLITLRQCKTGRPLTLPLLPDVAAALVAYLRDGRPMTTHREVFLRLRAPFEPFVAANNLNAIMRTALRRAGLAERPGRRGLYLFRHTLATHLLAAECPIKAIADVLGHVSSDTTTEYANIDLHALRRVALSEAEVVA